MIIRTTRKFERSLKKYKKKHYDIEKLFAAVDCIISQDKQLLSTKYKDHALVGDWKVTENYIVGKKSLTYSCS